MGQGIAESLEDRGPPTVRQRRLAVRGIELAYFEWGQPSMAPTILLVHATGFHARCWDGVVRALGGDWHVIAMDLRGHGRSSKRGPYEWREFGADVAAFVEALDLAGVIGVGHSMGGHSVTQAASQHPRRFSKLLLVDPVIMDPDTYTTQEMPFATPDQHPVSRRRNKWRSAEEMFARFADRQPFQLWDPDVLLDYCRYGLIATGDGFELACPPLVEAAIYQGSLGRDISAAVATLPHPVVVLRARRKAERGSALDFTQSPTWEGLAAALPNGRDVYLPELTHFIPMQNPALVAKYIRELAAEAPAAS